MSRETQGMPFVLTHRLLKITVSLCLLAVLAGCGKKEEAAVAPAALPGGQTLHNIDNEPGMSPEAKAAAKKQFQQMQQQQSGTPAPK